MGLQIVERPLSVLGEYDRISIAFLVRRELTPVPAPNEPGGYRLSEHAIPQPWLKDYDVLAGCRPSDWPSRFDIRSWVFFTALADGETIGAAAVVFDPSSLGMENSGGSTAVLWDIRVKAEMRGRGAGSQLLGAAEASARVRGRAWLIVETQNVNADACDFYRRHGFALFEVQPGAYAELPAETRLLWRKPLHR